MEIENEKFNKYDIKPSCTDVSARWFYYLIKNKTVNNVENLNHK